MTARRTLDWHDLHEAVADAQMLHERGYQRAGHWDLAQVVGHLTIFVQGSMHGFAIRVPAIVPWAMRVTGQRDKLFRTRRMPRGMPIPRRLRITDPASDPQDEARALEQFAGAVDRFLSHRGEHARSPVLGELTHEQWHAFHVIHAMHHLGFLVPRD